MKNKNAILALLKKEYEELPIFFERTSSKIYFITDKKGLQELYNLLGTVKQNIDNIMILGAGGSVAATFTTSYYLVKHLLYVRKRNRFYKRFNLVLNKKKRKTKLKI